MSIRAAIDCGSNTTRLLIVDADGNPVARDLRTTRLGHRVDSTGELAPESIDRTLFALADFKNQMESAGVQNSRAVATSAVRDSVNAAELLSNASAVLGHELEVMSGTDEAALAYRGAVASRVPADYLLIDIGGGSTELVVGNPQGLIHAVSMNIGCVRVTEQFFRGGPYTQAELEAARVALEQTFQPALSSLRRPPQLVVVGVAGTITTLASLVHGVAEWSPGAVHDKILTASAVDQIFSTMTEMANEGLQTLVGMPADRADVIVAGTAVLRAFMAVFEVQSLIVSEKDILDGIVAGL